MVGYRPRRSDQYSFNFGIGGILDLDTRILGDGIIANGKLPPRETSARTKQTTGAGLLLLFFGRMGSVQPLASPQPGHSKPPLPRDPSLLGFQLTSFIESG